MFKKILVILVVHLFCLGLTLPAIAADDSADYELRVTQLKEGNAIGLQAYCKNVSDRLVVVKARFTVVRMKEGGDPSLSGIEKNLRLKPGQEEKVGAIIVSPPISEIKVELTKNDQIIVEELFPPE